MSEKKIEFQESHEWKYVGENFCVIVKGFKMGKEKYTGAPEFENWNVYLYVYPGHPRFKDCQENIWGCPYNLPGASFYDKNITLSKLSVKDENGVASHQYGNDYNHLWNEGWDLSHKKHRAFADARELIQGIEESVAELSEVKS